MAIVMLRCAIPGNGSGDEGPQSRVDVDLVQIKPERKRPERMCGHRAIDKIDHSQAHGDGQASRHPLKRMDIDVLKRERRRGAVMYTVDRPVQVVIAVQRTMKEIEVRIIQEHQKKKLSDNRWQPLPLKIEGGVAQRQANHCKNHQDREIQGHDGKTSPDHLWVVRSALYPHAPA